MATKFSGYIIIPIQCWGNWITRYRRGKLDPFLIPLSKINSKWIKGVNRRLTSIKLLEENTQKMLLDFRLANIFFGYDKKKKSQKVPATIVKINK